MTQDQFDRETNCRLAFSIFKQLFSRGLISEKDLSIARQKLIDRFNPPIGRLADAIAAPV